MAGDRRVGGVCMQRYQAAQWLFSMTAPVYIRPAHFTRESVVPVVVTRKTLRNGTGIYVGLRIATGVVSCQSIELSARGFKEPTSQAEADDRDRLLHARGYPSSTAVHDKGARTHPTSSCTTIPSQQLHLHVTSITSMLHPCSYIHVTSMYLFHLFEMFPHSEHSRSGHRKIRGPVSDQLRWYQVRKRVSRGRIRRLGEERGRFRTFERLGEEQERSLAHAP